MAVSGREGLGRDEPGGKSGGRDRIAGVALSDDEKLGKWIDHAGGPTGSPCDLGLKAVCVPTCMMHDGMK